MQTSLSPSLLSDILVFLHSSLHHFVVVVTSLNECIVCIVEEKPIEEFGTHGTLYLRPYTVHHSLTEANGKGNNNKGNKHNNVTKRSSDLLKGKGAWPQEEPRSSTVVIRERSHRRAGPVSHYEPLKISFPTTLVVTAFYQLPLQHIFLVVWIRSIIFYCFIAINFA